MAKKVEREISAIDFSHGQMGKHQLRLKCMNHPFFGQKRKPVQRIRARVGRSLVACELIWLQMK